MEIIGAHSIKNIFMKKTSLFFLIILAVIYTVDAKAQTRLGAYP